MTQDEKSALPAMEGDGFYNRHSALQASGIRHMLPLWRSIVESITPGDSGVTIVDYGASQGRNSMAPIALAIETLRAKSRTSAPITVIHTDLPGNDFSSLFEAILTDEASYLTAGAQIYPLALGRSYFEQILPENSVDLGWNSWTLHWMSRNPVQDPDFFYGAFSKTESVRAAVAELLAEDWRNFLRLRSRELKMGGRLFSLFLSKGPPMTGWEWMLNQFWQSILELTAEGRLSETEKRAINLPLGPRDLQEIEAPFGMEKEFSGLKLAHAEVFRLADPFWPHYQQTMDAAQFGQDWKNMMKAVFAPVVKGAIDPEKDAAALVDDLFERFARRMAEAPREIEHYVGVAVLQKIAAPSL